MESPFFSSSPQASRNRRSPCDFQLNNHKVEERRHWKFPNYRLQDQVQDYLRGVEGEKGTVLVLAYCLSRKVLQLLKRYELLENGKDNIHVFLSRVEKSRGLVLKETHGPCIKIFCIRFNPFHSDCTAVFKKCTGSLFNI